MANIRKRGNKFQVQVRRTGYKSYTKTFSRLSEARAWARAQEVNIDKDEAGINKPVTVKLSDLLTRYQQEITLHKKSKDSETRRISRLLRDPISKTRLCDLSPDKLASFRDKRLKDGQRPEALYAGLGHMPPALVFAPQRFPSQSEPKRVFRPISELSFVIICYMPCMGCW